MPHFDTCLAWNWEYDADFVHLFEAACVLYGVSLLQITPENLQWALNGLQAGELTFTSLLDRASEEDSNFQPLVDWAKRRRIYSINPQKQTLWSGDKATMHHEFIQHGLQTPQTIILSPHSRHASLRCPDLTSLNGCFVIKPACGGGGQGVILEASSWEQVEFARQQYPAEKYLLQAHVDACQLDGRKAWFRILVCQGAVYPCWWDQHTHVYTRVTASEKARFGLRLLTEASLRISQICGLHLFSTEIAFTQDGQFLIVDYVNDPVDLRLQSKAVDGVPDIIVENIAHRLVRLVQALA
jgi:hypothetical protein